MDNLQFKYPVGSVWANEKAHKIIILVHDFITDSFIVYNYELQVEQIIRRANIEDNLSRLKPWVEYISYQKGLWDGLVDNFECNLRSRLASGRKIEVAPPTPAITQFKENGEYRYYHYEMMLGRKIKSLDKFAVNSDINAMIESIDQALTKAKVNEIYYRTPPEFEYFIDSIRGTQMIKFYCRFVCLSDGKPLEKEQLEHTTPPDGWRTQGLQQDIL